MLPNPISPSQTDCKSPIDDDLMDSIRLNLDYLDSLFADTDYTLTFGLDGSLIGAANFRRPLDIVPLFKDFTPETCRILVKKSGNIGKFKIDIATCSSVKVPIIAVESVYSQATLAVSQSGATNNTQSITLATPNISTQSITFAKSTLSVQSIINVGGNRWRYNFSTAPDADWAIGDSVSFAGCTNANNNGLFTIVEVNQSGGANVVVANATGVAQTGAAGTCQLMLMSYNHTNPVSSEYVSGEQFVSTGHTTPANNGTFTIFKINQSGNNIWVKNSAGVTQGAAAGTCQVGRFVYAYTSATITAAVGELGTFAGHTNAVNNGNFRITSYVGNNITVYNPAGVTQGAAVGTGKGNRWAYQVGTNPTSFFSAGQFAQMEGHASAANNGIFPIVVVNAAFVIVYNPNGVFQGSTAGTTRHTRKLVKFSTDQSANFAIGTKLELSGLPDGLYNLNDFRAPYEVIDVNVGGGANYNVMIDVPNGSEVVNPAGYVMTTYQSIFSAKPEINPNVTALSANDYITFVSTSVFNTVIAAGTPLALFVEEWQGGDPETIRVTLHN
jgi:hypothetical protein